MISHNKNGEILLQVEDLTKTYTLWESPFSRLGDALASKMMIRNKKVKEQKVTALQGVNFVVRKGECLGIIGRNGSGKSTLLQILAGTMRPTTGIKKVQGRVGAILELGSGFHPEFTGRENLRMATALLGITKRETRQLEAEILEFSEVEHAIDHPIKTYSQGMILRLAFAIQTCVRPDLLLIDEALSVGDVFFQQKCAERIRELQQLGTAFILVSHDTGAIRHYCQKALFLHQGKQIYYGEVLKAVHYYHRLNGTGELTEMEVIEKDEEVDKYVTSPESEMHFWVNPDRSPMEDEWVKITGVDVCDASGHPTWFTEINGKLRIQVRFTGRSSMKFDVTCQIKNRYGQMVVSMSSHEVLDDSIQGRDSKELMLEFEFDCALQSGEYTMSFVVGPRSREGETQANVIGRRSETPWIGPLQVRWSDPKQKRPFHGMFGLKFNCEVREG